MSTPIIASTLAPALPLSHLFALTDDRGVFEHALLDVPRREHGYCTDDIARALIVVVREPQARPDVGRLAEIYLTFLESAVQGDGSVHNRMSADGRWTDMPGLGDWWGRAVWGLGIAATAADSDDIRARALATFRVAIQRRSPYGRSMVFATLGAAAVLAAHPSDLSARALTLDGVATVKRTRDSGWSWPERRLRYGNAAVPEALIVGGAALDAPDTISHGLRLLRFLLQVETRDGHLSVTGVDGRGPAQRHSAQYDQQPIEVAAIADACAHAFAITGDHTWLDNVSAAWRWFAGDNDSTTPMCDPATGAGFDGLEAQGRNENRGAESTIAALSTHQQARRLHSLPTLP